MPHLEVPTAPGRVSLDAAPGRVSFDVAPGRVSLEAAPSAAATAAAASSSRPYRAPRPQPQPQPQASANPAKRFVAWIRRKSQAPNAAVPAYDERRSRPRPSVEAREYMLLDHVGALDPSAITRHPPGEVMRRVVEELLDMGVSVRHEGPGLRIECVRPRRASAGLKALFGARSANDRPRMSMSRERPGTAMANVLQPRMSLSPERESAEINRSLARMSLADPYTTPANTPLYGEPSRDGGQEIRFYVQLTRIPTLRGLYSVDIRHVKGNHWTFQYLYQALLGRLDLGDSV